VHGPPISGTTRDNQCEWQRHSPVAHTNYKYYSQTNRQLGLERYQKRVLTQYPIILACGERYQYPIPIPVYSLWIIFVVGVCNWGMSLPLTLIISGGSRYGWTVHSPPTQWPKVGAARSSLRRTWGRAYHLNTVLNFWPLCYMKVPQTPVIGLHSPCSTLLFGKSWICCICSSSNSNIIIVIKCSLCAAKHLYRLAKLRSHCPSD